MIRTLYINFRFVLTCQTRSGMRSLPITNESSSKCKINKYQYFTISPQYIIVFINGGSKDRTPCPSVQLSKKLKDHLKHLLNLLLGTLCQTTSSVFLLLFPGMIQIYLKHPSISRGTVRFYLQPLHTLTNLGKKL